MMLEAEEWVRTTMEKFALAYQGERGQISEVAAAQEPTDIGIAFEPEAGE
jgi:hypothetical protein